ncbi:MAG: CRISPR system precrRNA processing endoribonuclease RAMP protein Cas6 [Xanthomonadales bacterium]|nr:CRISPR system precrRNA processing endoribonuclease RAMP protein Cas6 [Xanthomonadales bacterium]
MSDLPGWSHQLNLLRFEFRYRAEEQIEFLPWTGAVLHGALGRAGQRVSAAWGRLLYPSRTGLTGRAAPNPFSLMPWAIGSNRLALGETFGFSVTLFGDAARYGDAMCATALAAAENGFGTRREGARGRASLVSATCGPPGGSVLSIYESTGKLWRKPPLPGTAAEVLAGARNPARQLRVRFVTPAQIVVGGGDMQQAPDYSLLLQRLHGRLAQIASELAGFELPQAQRQAWVQGAGAVALNVDRTLLWPNADPAVCGRVQRGYRGLVGEAEYCGDMHNAASLLALAEWTGIGKKTSYGFGNLRIGTVEALS